MSLDERLKKILNSSAYVNVDADFIYDENKAKAGGLLVDGDEMVMTGQEWYDRFCEELNQFMLANSVKEIMEDPKVIIEAAKRASGISQKDEEQAEKEVRKVARAIKRAAGIKQDEED